MPLRNWIHPVRSIIFVWMLLNATVSLADGPDSEDKDSSATINTLVKNVFKVSEKNGVLVLKKTTMGVKKFQEGKNSYWTYKKTIADEKHDYDFSDYASLNRSTAAQDIPGTSLIMAFLDYPASDDRETPNLVTLFRSSNPNVPLCSGFINLFLSADGPYRYGYVEAITVRTLRPDDYLVGVKSRGGDGGEYWTDLAFLHMNARCEITPLYRRFAEWNHTEKSESGCEGSEVNYSFLDSHTVKIDETPVVNCPPKPNTGLLETRQVDLQDLLLHPALRNERWTNSETHVTSDKPLDFTGFVGPKSAIKYYQEVTEGTTWENTDTSTQFTILLIICVPGVLLLGVGWWLSRRLLSRRFRIFVRTVLVIVALIPVVLIAVYYSA